MPVLNNHIVVFTGFKCVYQYANTKPGDVCLGNRIYNLILSIKLFALD